MHFFFHIAAPIASADLPAYVFYKLFMCIMANALVLNFFEKLRVISMLRMIDMRAWKELFATPVHSLFLFLSFFSFCYAIKYKRGFYVSTGTQKPIVLGSATHLFEPSRKYRWVLRVFI